MAVVHTLMWTIARDSCPLAGEFTRKIFKISEVIGLTCGPCAPSSLTGLLAHQVLRKNTLWVVDVQNNNVREVRDNLAR